METKMFYDAPRSISIGDIFYVIDTREGGGSYYHVAHLPTRQIP